MKKIFLISLLIVLQLALKAQPSLVNTSAYAQVSTIAYDSLSNNIYYNALYGCVTWGIPCAYTYTSAQNNLINKHHYYDNTVSTVLSSTFQVGPPPYAVNNFNSVTSRQTIINGSSIYTNFGYYFNKIDTVNYNTIWSYSVNSSYKEISTFQIKGDSVYLLEKDSTSSKNYYTLKLKNRLTGSSLPYNSLSASNPWSGAGAIEGYINTSVVKGNKLILSGVFTASVGGTFVGRNLVSVNILTGQLQASPTTFLPGTSIYDMKYLNNKLYLVGKFTAINSQSRKNFAVLDVNLNLLSDTLQFGGSGPTWVDKIVFYDKYIIAKGNFNSINNNVLSVTNTYGVKVIDMTNNSILPWTINLPGTPQISDYTFEIAKHKLYIKNRTPGNNSSFYIYCFEPILYTSSILFQTGGGNPMLICAPDNGSHIYSAPIKYASSYTWAFSGANATVVPIGDGRNAKIVAGASATSGILSVYGTNDCGLSTSTATFNIVINPKPTFTIPSSPQLIKCNPDSTLLQGITTNTNNVIWWYKAGTNQGGPPPFYVKNPGNYYMVATDPNSGCKDSAMVTVNNFKAKPNSKITSHAYPGVSTPIDTVTCYQPIVVISAASDTSGVNINWKSISSNSVFSNPLNTTAQDNYKIIATRNNNGCTDSSMIVLVAKDNTKPNISLNNYSTLNCSYNTTTITASYSPSNCTSSWSGPSNYTSANPAVINTVGKYYISVNNSLNGCSQIDSATIIYDPKIYFNKSNDTVVCKQSMVTLTASAIGTLSPITYSWNTGASGNMLSTNVPVSTSFIVYANGPGACSGIDTIYVTVPPNMEDSVSTIRSCNNNSSGTIIVFVQGGIAPYQYSINGTTFSSANSFTGIPFGNYNIVIKDFLGCIKTTSASLNATSNLPVPEFLASTSNVRNDTIVLVDISIPKADSVQWLLPAQAAIIGGNRWNPVVLVNDTGAFIVTMKAFYGNCIISTTKLIRFMEIDSLVASSYNMNGIKSYSLYPNPNTGVFNVTVEFFKKQNVSIQIWDAGPTKHLQHNYYDVDNINLPVNLGYLQNGTYILRIIGEYDSKNKIFIISK